MGIPRAIARCQAGLSCLGEACRRKDVFALCAVAALGYVALLHYRMIVILPDPIFQPDSITYLSPALDGLYGHGFPVLAERSLGYPLWILCWLKAAHHFRGLLMAQHLLCLSAALAAALLAYRYVAASKWSALLIFGTTAALPRMLVYSHAVLTDAVYACCLTVNVLTLLTALKSSRLWPWILLAIGTWLGLLLRPAGASFLCVATGVILVSYFKDRQRAKFYAAGVLTFLALWTVTCSVNLKWRGFWGFDRFGALSLFGTTAPYLSPDSLSDLRLKSILLPTYQRHSFEMKDPNWVRFSPEGPASALSTHFPDSAEANQAMVHLSYIAIIEHPWRLLWDQTVLFSQFLWTRSGRPDHLLTKADTVAHGLSLFATQVKKYPRAAELVTFSPPVATAYFRRIAETPLYPYELTPATYPLAFLLFGMRWVQIAALLFSALLFRIKRMRGTVIIFWLVIVAHIFLANLGGDFDGRHALPIEPLCVLLSVSGLEVAFKFRRIPQDANLQK